MHGWTSRQRNAAIASFLSWTLDAFDFFLLVFLLSDIAHSFHVDLEEVTLAILLTLAVRPVGALIFGRAAEKFGRKPILMLNIVFFSAFELLSAAAPSLMLFFLLRVLYGVAMGGIWGVASSLAMETIPDRSRGLMSGLFQAGYPFGYLLAAVAYGLLFEQLGWRGMFVIGAAPVLLLPFIYFCVEESPVWQAARQNKESTALLPVLRSHWKLCLYLVVLMAAFNFFSHGTQDLYPVFLKVQHGFEPKTVSIIAVCYNIASIIGGVFFGSLSEKIGRRKAIMIAALLALPVIPLWAFASGSLALGAGAFLMQFMVQGAWGVIPTWLNELVPANTRAVLPGFVYQLGNLLASVNATLQASIAQHHGHNYGLAMALVAGTVAIVITVLTFFGREGRVINPQERDITSRSPPAVNICDRAWPGARSHTLVTQTNRRRLAFLQRADPNPHHDEQRAKQMPGLRLSMQEQDAQHPAGERDDVGVNFAPRGANGGDTFVPEQIGQPRWENYQIRQAAEEKRLAPGCPVLRRVAHQPEDDDWQQDQGAEQRADGDKAIRRDSAVLQT